MLQESYEPGLERSELTADSGHKKGSVTRMLMLASFLCVVGSSIVHGYSSGVLNAPEFTIQAFYNDTYIYRFKEPIGKSLLNFLWAITISIYLVGGMVGIFSSGYFADKFGRRSALQLSHIFAVLAAIFFVMARPTGLFELIIVGRLIIGFSTGIGCGIVPMYLTECSPKHIRGSLGVLHQLGLTVGVLISQILGLEELLGSDDLWPILLILSAVPGLIVSFFFPCVPESPRYLLIIKKDKERAEKALKSLRGEDHDVKGDIQEMRAEQMQLEAEPPWTIKQLLKAKKLRHPLLLLCALQAGQQLSGINVVFYYSTGIFMEAGIPDEYVRYATLGTGVMNVAMTIIVIYLMERAGRRPLLLWSHIGMGISASIITIGLNVQEYASGIAYVSFVCTLTFVLSYNIGLGPIPLFLGGELFKQGPRPAAMSFSGVFNWLANFLVGITVPFILAGLKAFTFIPFLVIAMIGTIITHKYVKETKNKTYDEIAKRYYRRSVDDLDADGTTEYIALKETNTRDV